MAITCTPTALLAQAGCIPCLTPFQIQTIQTYLLCQIRLALDPMATCDIQELQDGASCFACLTPFQLQIIQVYLWCQIANGGGGGAGTDYNIIRDAPSGPPEPDPADATKVWILTFRDGSPSLVWDPDNLAWF